MARKTLGFIPLIWQCAFCNTQNPGPIKSCTSCGAPQPEDVEFLRVDEEQFNFVKDEALIRMAQAGPDIHCPFCGTRNVAEAETCKKCGGELSVGGKARQTGQEVRTVSEAQAPRPPVPSTPAQTAPRKVPVVPIIIISLAVIVGCIILMVLLFRTDDITATVTDLQWERVIAVEAYTTVTGNDWWDNIPASASIQSCTMTYRFTSNEPQANATEVCSEPYVEDTGTGIGEVVQDCTYQVYDDYCEYTMMDWVIVDRLTESGRDQSPAWPTTVLESDQREGQRSETYMIVFDDGDETYRYTTTDPQLFMQADVGSRWLLQINQLGGIQSIEPAN
jgi:hypothetical protein